MINLWKYENLILIKKTIFLYLFKINKLLNQDIKLRNGTHTWNWVFYLRKGAKWPNWAKWASINTTTALNSSASSLISGFLAVVPPITAIIPSLKCDASWWTTSDNATLVKLPNSINLDKWAKLDHLYEGPSHGYWQSGWTNKAHGNASALHQRKSDVNGSCYRLRNRKLVRDFPLWLRRKRKLGWYENACPGTLWLVRKKLPSRKL